MDTQNRRREGARCPQAPSDESDSRQSWSTSAARPQISTPLAEQQRQVATAEFQLRQAELKEEEDERLLALGDQFSDLDPDDNERVQRWLNTEHVHKDNQQLKTETAPARARSRTQTPPPQNQPQLTQHLPTATARTSLPNPSR